MTISKILHIVTLTGGPCVGSHFWCPSNPYLCSNWSLAVNIVCCCLVVQYSIPGNPCRIWGCTPWNENWFDYSTQKLTLKTLKKNRQIRAVILGYQYFSKCLWHHQKRATFPLYMTIWKSWSELVHCSHDNSWSYALLQ